jgi:aminopeptidase N
MSTDQLVAARAMRQPVDSNEAIEASFDNDTTYGKGAAVLHMFEQWIGPERFQTFIRSYIGSHAWGTATADDFVGALTAAAGAEAATAFRTFLDQPGVPSIDMELRCTRSATTLHLAQRRSLLEGTTAPSSSTWHIPVCVRHGSGRRLERQCWLLTTPEVDVSLAGPCPKVLVPNAAGDGYYRSTLAGRTASPAITGLPRRERITLINDASAAWQRGQLAITSLIELGLRLHDDRDPRVARHAIYLLWTFSPDLLEDDDRQRFDRMVMATFGARARKLGWQRRVGDDDDLHDLRMLLVAAVAEHDAGLRDEAARLADAFLRDSKSVPDDIVDLVLRIAATTSGRPLFDRLLANARATANLRLRRRLLRALGAFHEPTLAAAARELVITRDLDPRETLAILSSQLGERRTRDDAWNWARAHLPALLSEMRDDEAGALIGRLAEVYCDRAHREEASTWLTPLAEHVDGARNALSLALERTENCIRIAERDRPAVQMFLTKY